ncbi:C2 calcium-dependent domain-containing protein 4D [Periophthalmus magnuspinnatus]|uniref:C2 calcium-dependent domain-containing protein 4D n=1 Tax=Periophthalmus magnuspinnatus TaxID=409849 RepID=UPI00145A57ED|nr:C2 calcium-dependent domain-containing protein 4D [Periophthalmus magnuspinnatus]
MWVLEKLRDTVSLDWNFFMDKTEEKGPSHCLHHNIITPEQIPEFSLPPRLCKSPSVPLTQQDPLQLLPKPHHPNKPHPERATRPESLGLYERPNTKRKESLFHAKRPVYLFDRSPATRPPGPAPGPAPQPRFGLRAAGTRSGAVAPQSGSVSSLCESSSSCDTSPLASPSMLRGADSCPALTQILRTPPGPSRSGPSPPSPSGLSPPSPSGLSPSSLSPLFPLDVLRCWDRLPTEHELPLEGRGTVRLSIEHYHTHTTPPSSRCTVRLRVASVERVSALSCALHVCLMPGRRQRQRSAIIRQSRVTYRFNEDFFFTELEEEELRGLQLRVKVLDKTAGGARLRRGALVGVVSKPMTELLDIDKK